MTTELNHLISEMHAAVQEEHAAKLRRKHEEAIALIREQTRRLETALDTYLGNPIVHALYGAEGRIEAWMRGLNEHLAFTPEAWEDEGFPKIYVVLAFSYKGCRFHLMYLESNRSLTSDDQGQWTLSIAKPVTPIEPAQGDDHQELEHPGWHRIFYPESRSMLASDRRRLLLMIDGLTNARETPE